MIFRRYLFREIILSFSAVLAVLLLVFISSRFVRFLAEAAAGRMASDLILQILALKLAASVVVLIPLAIFIAVMLGLSRLHRDGELVAMTAGGFGVFNVLGSVTYLAGGFALVASVLSLWVTPMLETAADELTKRARNSTEISGIFPGRFKTFGDQGQVFYVERVSPDRRQMSNVFIQVPGADSDEVIIAKRARYLVEETGNRYLVLEDGHRYEGTPGDPDYIVTAFVRHGVQIHDDETNQQARKISTIDTAELLGSDDLEYAGELHWRLALPISTVMLTILAVPLGYGSPGSGRLFKIVVGILVYFIYNNLLSAGVKSIEGGLVPREVGLWPIHLLMAIMVGAFVAYHGALKFRRGWTLRRARGPHRRSGGSNDQEGSRPDSSEAP